MPSNALRRWGKKLVDRMRRRATPPVGAILSDTDILPALRSGRPEERPGVGFYYVGELLDSGQVVMSRDLATYEPGTDQWEVLRFSDPVSVPDGWYAYGLPAGSRSRKDSDRWILASDLIAAEARSRAA